jgi:hypothetical protein
VNLNEWAGGIGGVAANAAGFLTGAARKPQTVNRLALRHRTAAKIAYNRVV